MVRVREFFDRWWRTFVSAGAVVVVATMVFVSWTVIDERDYFEGEQARDRRQDRQVADVLDRVSELVERQRTVDANREDHLAQAIGEVEALVADQFGRHDTNSATVHNDLLAQIAALLGRPAGVTTDPVAARDVDPPPRSPDDQRQPPPPADEPRDEPAPTTTTTQPGRSGLCDRLPDTPICRRAR